MPAQFSWLPHDVTQRGNARQQTFFEGADYRLHRDLVAERASAARVAVWSWALMPNHVHLILVPEEEDGLRRVLAAVHRRYAGHVHARLRRTGHFWQGRYGCVAMDEAHCAAALRYVALNTVHAGLVKHARDWRRASTRASLGEGDDGITATASVSARIDGFAALLASGEDEQRVRRVLAAEALDAPSAMPLYNLASLNFERARISAWPD